MLPAMAGSFLAEGRVIGKHWGERFLQRHGLETIMSRQLDCQRAWNDDLVIINDWFKFFRGVRNKYRIRHSKFISNFDEKGVTLGIAAIARVIVSGRNSKESSKNRSVQHPGSRESVSIIETINADGSYLPPFLIWKGERH